ncbi:hypothetical protein Mame01_42450 [Microbispora amethystogenes]|nr:hypothetical protein Mame01_42450 [Microbispora amethystogenes]
MQPAAGRVCARSQHGRAPEVKFSVIITGRRGGDDRCGPGRERSHLLGRPSGNAAGGCVHMGESGVFDHSARFAL